MMISHLISYLSYVILLLSLLPFTSCDDLNSLDLARTIRTSVLCDVTIQDSYLLNKLINAYKLVANDVEMILRDTNDNVGNQHVIDNQSDFAVTGKHGIMASHGWDGIIMESESCHVMT